MTACECPVAGYCKRHRVRKPQGWHNLCKTREDYFAMWERGEGPGQGVRKVTTSSAPPISCSFLQGTNCSLVQELTDKPSPVTPEICRACLTTNNPSAVNIVTISLASRINPEREYDISKLGTGFGTTLAKIFKPFLSEVRGCGCKGKQDILDLWTPEYIKNNIDRVVEFLADSARKKRIPFSYKLTRLLLISLLKVTN